MWNLIMKPTVFAILISYAVGGWASTFVNVEDDQAIRANGGSVEIKVESTKPYLLRLSDEVFVVDPKEQVTSHTFENVDRGTHKLELVSDGVKQSITIHVLRVHR